MVGVEKKTPKNKKGSKVSSPKILDELSLFYGINDF
jgi:hypothetical protein